MPLPLFLGIGAAVAGIAGVAIALVKGNKKQDQTSGHSRGTSDYSYRYADPRVNSPSYNHYRDGSSTGSDGIKYTQFGVKDSARRTTTTNTKSVDVRTVNLEVNENLVGKDVVYYYPRKVGRKCVIKTKGKIIQVKYGKVHVELELPDFSHNKFARLDHNYEEYTEHDEERFENPVIFSVDEFKTCLMKGEIRYL